MPRVLYSYVSENCWKLMLSCTAYDVCKQRARIFHRRFSLLSTIWLDKVGLYFVAAGQIYDLIIFKPNICATKAVKKEEGVKASNEKDANATSLRVTQRPIGGIKKVMPEVGKTGQG